MSDAYAMPAQGMRSRVGPVLQRQLRRAMWQGVRHVAGASTMGHWTPAMHPGSGVMNDATGEEGHGEHGPNENGPHDNGPEGHGPHEHGPHGHGHGSHRGGRKQRFGGPGFSGGFGGGGFGRPGFGGFGPGGPGFGPPEPGFVPEGPPEGRGGGHRFGPGRGRRQRGNVRIAVLALLVEEPRHGYAIMNELAERSGGLWRPSPGSVYPVLQQLQDEGLVTVEETEGRRIFSLTDTGRSYVAEHADELREPWKVAEQGPRRRVQSLVHAMGTLGVAVEQVARLSDDAQAARALAVLDDARRSMYRILAGDDGQAPAQAAPADDPDAGA